MNNTHISMYIANIGGNTTHEYSSDIKVLIELPIIFFIICCLSTWAYRDYEKRHRYENRSVVINYKNSDSPGCITPLYNDPYINRNTSSEKTFKSDKIPV